MIWIIVLNEFHQIMNSIRKHTHTHTQMQFNLKIKVLVLLTLKWHFVLFVLVSFLLLLETGVYLDFMDRYCVMRSISLVASSYSINLPEELSFRFATDSDSWIIGCNYPSWDIWKTAEFRLRLDREGFRGWEIAVLVPHPRHCGNAKIHSCSQRWKPATVISHWNEWATPIWKWDKIDLEWISPAHQIKPSEQ